MRRCAFLTMDDLADFECYDALLYAPLRRLGWAVSPVPWRKADVDWNRFEVVVIRSPWDYQADPARFIRVLETIDRSTAHLENPLRLVKWNIDKRYLRDLEQRGIPIVPTRWTGRFAAADFNRLCDQLGTSEIVVKPTVGAGGFDTFRVSDRSLAVQAPRLASAFASRPCMVQPFMPSVVNEGEYSLFFFAGEYSHAILKTPGPEEFRVQEEHGGVLSLVEPEAVLLRLALDAVAAVAPLPLYARVDLVRNGTGFALMELELIEPSLYFNMDPVSPRRFAAAFARRMGSIP